MLCHPDGLHFTQSGTCTRTPAARNIKPHFAAPLSLSLCLKAAKRAEAACLPSSTTAEVPDRGKTVCPFVYIPSGFAKEVVVAL